MAITNTYIFDKLKPNISLEAFQDLFVENVFEDIGKRKSLVYIP